MNVTTVNNTTTMATTTNMIILLILVITVINFINSDATKSNVDKYLFLSKVVHIHEQTS